MWVGAFNAFFLFAPTLRSPYHVLVLRHDTLSRTCLRPVWFLIMFLILLWSACQFETYTLHYRARTQALVKVLGVTGPVKIAGSCFALCCVDGGGPAPLADPVFPAMALGRPGQTASSRVVLLHQSVQLDDPSRWLSSPG